MKLIFETHRLLVRECVEEDAAAFFKLNSDSEVLRYVPDKALVSVEEALASVRYGFAELGLEQIIGLVLPENIASVRVLEKAGLRCTGDTIFWNGRYVTTA